MDRGNEEDVDDQSPVPGTSSTPDDVGLGRQSKKRPSAVIWQHFTKLGPCERRCNQCSSILKLKTGSTTSMITHLEGKHPVAHKQYVAELKSLDAKTKSKQQKLAPFLKQPKIGEMFSMGEKWPHNHPKAKLIRTAVTTWMAKSLHPYSIVEEKGFVDLMRVVEPKYVVPSRTTFSRNLMPELYARTKAKVESEIQENINGGISSVSITTDLWTSSANDAFLSVNAHFLDSSFKLRTFCLENAHFEEEHNGRNVANKLREIVEQTYHFKASQTIPIFCVTDNATNMVSALSLITDWTHLRCFAHTLQLALHDAKRDVVGMSKILSKARAIVGHYKHSTVTQNRLNKLQEQLGMKTLHLIQDCETRWNSEYNMLSRLLELKQPISADLVNVGHIDNLTSNEWELAEGYTTILKPLNTATTLASSNSLPTLSSVLPVIDGIKAVLRNYVQAGKKGVMFARALEKFIKTRFPDAQYLMNKHYLLAMTVDPRYKTVILEDTQTKTAVEMLKREAQQHQERLKQQNASASASSSTVTSEGQKDTQDQAFSLWHNFQSRSGKVSAEEAVEGTVIKNQVDAFLSIPTIDMQEDPCNWWKANCCIYTYIAPIAKMYLGIPATEVESERVFSSAGNVVNERRRSLKQEHVSELVFLHHNI